MMSWGNTTRTPDDFCLGAFSKFGTKINWWRSLKSISFLPVVHLTSTKRSISTKIYDGCVTMQNITVVVYQQQLATHHAQNLESTNILLVMTFYQNLKKVIIISNLQILKPHQFKKLTQEIASHNFSIQNKGGAIHNCHKLYIEKPKDSRNLQKQFYNNIIKVKSVALRSKIFSSGRELIKYLFTSTKSLRAIATPSQRRTIIPSTRVPILDTNRQGRASNDQCSQTQTH